MRTFYSIIFAIGLLFVTDTCFSELKSKPEIKKEKIKIRIGWYPLWPIEGQIVQVLKKTDILAKHGLEAEFVATDNAPGMMELTMGNKVDAALMTDQNAVNLFMKNNNWVAIARLPYSRVATYVPLNSDINSVKDLKGKQVGVLYGSAAQRLLTKSLDKNKVTNVRFVNTIPIEQIPLLFNKVKSQKQWGDFDAFTASDPIPAFLEIEENAKIIDKGKTCGLVVVNKKFLDKDEKLALNFIKSVEEAQEYYRKNTKEVNGWYIEESKMLRATNRTFLLAGELEPNLKKGKKIVTAFSTDDFGLIQEAADFASKTTFKKIDVKDFVTNKYQ